MPLPILPSVFAFTSVQGYLRAWFAHNTEASRTRLARWLSRRMACTPGQVFNLLSKHLVQPDQVPGLARVLGLEGRAREHLRRLVALQNATEDELKACRLSVWEMNAAHLGVPATQIAALCAREDQEGSDEGALLGALALLGAPEDGASVERVLLAPPQPPRLDRAITAARAGELPGERVSTRMIAFDPPCGPGTDSAAAWHGRLNLARECMLRAPTRERALASMIWTADEASLSGVERAVSALTRTLQKIVTETALAPVQRVYHLTLEQVCLTDVMRHDEERPAAQTGPSRLPRPSPRSRIDVERLPSAIPDPSIDPPPPLEPLSRPCLYRYLRFPDYARHWTRWRQALGDPHSAAWLSRRASQRRKMSRSLLHALCAGTMKLRPEHVDAVAHAFALLDEERPYLEGMARWAVATDPEDRGREQHALLRWAASQGARTLEGELWRVSAHWAPKAIWAMGFLPFFWVNPIWVYRVLHGRITIEDAEDMLTALLGAGLLVKQPEGPPRPSREAVRAIPPEPELARYAQHDSVFTLLQHELWMPVPGQRYLGWALALPDEALPLVHAALGAFWEAIRVQDSAAQARADAGPNRLDRVQLTATQLLPITHPLTQTLTRADPGP